MTETKKIEPIESIRNIAVIAHVDHGKTTLVDKLLKATDSLPTHQDLGECILDSNDLERERGITILAKNISLPYKGVKINLIDTPGHADFGGEVERVLQMADGVLLLVDAAEGPMPQTRFVLKKAFGHRLRPLVVINKIDRPDSRLNEVVDEIGELFLELSEELELDTVADFGGHDVLDFPIIYSSATGGYARLSPEDDNDNVTPLLDMMIDQIPPPNVEQDSPLQLQITTLDYNDYVGRIGIGRVTKGSIETGDKILVCGREETRKETVTDLFIFDKLGRTPINKVTAGDICAVTGIGNVEIGDTITDPEAPDPLPLIDIDRPTISMVFQVNDSPFAGQEGKFVTSRQLRDRLYKELESNVALRVENLSTAGSFEVSGRGTLHLGILIENMRRENYEFQVGKPRPIFIEENGNRKEPMELLHVQTPEESAGKVIELAGSRKGEMSRYELQGERILMQFKIPARGLIGMGSRLMSLTAGEAIICHNFDGYEAHKGNIPRRSAGVMVSSERVKAVGYSLFTLKDRGPMFGAPGEPIYEGMIVGEHCKDDDITVNLCREKKLTNVRAAGSDKNILLSPPRVMSIEEALEYIEEDELLEITPGNYRLRKRVLNAKLRRKDRRD